MVASPGIDRQTTTRNDLLSINQSNQLFLKWPKWHGHCKDHWLGEVSKLNQDMIAEIKNVLTVDEKLTVNLQRRRQLAVCSRCLEQSREWVTRCWPMTHKFFVNSMASTATVVVPSNRSFLCCQTLLDVYTVSQLHRQNVKGTSVPSMRVTLYLHSATTCIQKLLKHLLLFWKATKHNLTDVREKPSADLPQQLKVSQCNSYWVHVVALLLCSYRLIIGYKWYGFISTILTILLYANLW